MLRFVSVLDARRCKWFATAVIGFAATCLLPAKARAQEWPYLVTYSHELEEPGNLEIAFKNVQAAPHNGNQFISSTMELEYGATALVDHRSLSERAAHPERQHDIHRVSLGEPLPAAAARALHQSGPLRRVRRHQQRRQDFSRSHRPPQHPGFVGAERRVAADRRTLDRNKIDFVEQHSRLELLRKFYR